MKTKKRLVHATLASVALGGFVLACPTLAVFPPPDGGYPGFNTAEGQNALFSLTTGVGNAAVGWFSLFSNTDGSYNTALGAGTLLFNVGDQSTGDGTQNTAIGTAALLFNTAGSSNTAIGVTALLSNDGDFNTAVGREALSDNTEGINNTATGAFALRSNTTGSQNAADGFAALSFNTEGHDNTAAGPGALFGNITGNANTAVGSGALADNSSGNNNIALGFHAGGNLTTGNNNIDIGAFGVADEQNTIRIGVQGTHTAAHMAGIFGQTASGGIGVFINNDGKLGTTTSSERFKEEIKPTETASESLYALRPVVFRYKKEIDSAGTPQFGLVAEDVEKVNPDLIVRDEEGQPYSVRYDQVNAMLLNEFLKEHRKNEEQQSKIDQQEAKIVRQEKQIEALTAGLEKVSAQLAAASPSRGGLEASKPVPQTVLNNL
jgi:Chaperone of endosialidase